MHVSDNFRFEISKLNCTYEFRTQKKVYRGTFQIHSRYEFQMQHLKKEAVVLEVTNILFSISLQCD